MKRFLWVVFSFLIVSGCSSESKTTQQVLTPQPTQFQTAQGNNTISISQGSQTQTNAAIISATQTQSTKKRLNYSTLTAGDIQSQFIGVNLIWIYSPDTKYNGNIVFNANNTISRLGQQGRTTGQWRMEGNKICSYFPRQGKWAGIPWRCDPVIREGEKLYNGEFTYLRG